MSHRQLEYTLPTGSSRNSNPIGLQRNGRMGHSPLIPRHLKRVTCNAVSEVLNLSHSCARCGVGPLLLCRRRASHARPMLTGRPACPRWCHCQRQRRRPSCCSGRPSAGHAEAGYPRPPPSVALPPALPPRPRAWLAQRTLPAALPPQPPLLTTRLRRRRGGWRGCAP